jgi:nucleoside-diphosphate-sugar epimerase
LVPQVTQSLIAGREVACTSGNQVRDYSDTRDVAAGLAALLDVEGVTGFVNVASGRGVSVREICRLIVELTESPPELLRFGALADREGDPASLVADVTRLEREVGFIGERSLEERLADTVARYRRSSSGQPQFD